MSELDASDFAALSAAVDRPAEQLASEIQAQPGGVEGVLDKVFQGMCESFVPQKAAGQQAVVQYEITAPDGTPHQYVTRVADGACSWERGSDSSPRVTIKIGLLDFLKLIVGKLNGMQAFMTGKLKVSGDLFFAQTYQNWFEQPA